jgi:hypothetical protein
MMRLNRSALLVPALLLLVGACGREQRTIDVRGSFDVQRQLGGAAVLALEGRLYQDDLPSSDFDAMWSIVTRGTQAASGVTVTLSGGSERDASGRSVLAGVILVMPTPLSTGATYPIQHALAVPAQGMPMYWSFWGPVHMLVPGRADVGVRIFDYHASGMVVENDHVAVAATGTIEVLRRLGQQVELRLDVTTTDAAGRQATLRGDFTISPERYTPPIS